MVLVFNLDGEPGDGDAAATPDISQQPQLSSATITTWTRKPGLESINGISRGIVQNIGPFSAALACYPVISQIAQDLDLNTLDNLSRTCRLFQALLRAHRKALIALALRCSYDTRARRNGYSNSLGLREGLARLSFKLSPCATDLVGQCRRCGTVVCRNCTAKALPPSKLARRHRRLCNTCVRAPIPALLAAHIDSESPSFTYPAFAKTPCECSTSFWLCQRCGQSLPVQDTDYLRIWTWRIRYSTYLGGLGTGIGEGYEGVKCGRGEDCLAARKIEVEEECSSDSTTGTPREGISRPASQHSVTDLNDYDPDKAGYFRQEVEGIGGMLRSKVKRMVVVGQTVQEHEDERENGDYLSREANGISRSWCSWCERIILSSKDKKQMLHA